MKLIIGAWGDGTTVVAQIMEALGCDLGPQAHRVPMMGRPIGCLEDTRVVDALQFRQGEAALWEALDDLDTGPAALKMPWILVRPESWPIFDEHVEQTVWVRRLHPPQEMHAPLQKEARKNYPLLQQRWPGLEIIYEDLMRDPEGEVRKLADALGLEYRPEAAACVDREIPRHWREGQ